MSCKSKQVHEEPVLSCKIPDHASLYHEIRRSNIISLTIKAPKNLPPIYGLPTRLEFRYLPDLIWQQAQLAKDGCYGWLDLLKAVNICWLHATAALSTRFRSHYLDWCSSWHGLMIRWTGLSKQGNIKWSTSREQSGRSTYLTIDFRYSSGCYVGL